MGSRHRLVQRHLGLGAVRHSRSVRRNHHKSGDNDIKHDHLNVDIDNHDDSELHVVYLYGDHLNHTAIIVNIDGRQYNLVPSDDYQPAADDNAARLDHLADNYERAWAEYVAARANYLAADKAAHGQPADDRQQ